MATKQGTKARAVRWAAEEKAEIPDGAVGLLPAKKKASGEAADYGSRRAASGRATRATTTSVA